jgi:hypothetical protein
MSSANIDKFTSTSAMTVVNVSGTNLTYDASQNSAVQITVSKP